MNKQNGDWGLGIGDWGLGVGAPTPNPQTPTPKPKPPIFYLNNKKKKYLFNIF